MVRDSVFEFQTLQQNPKKDITLLKRVIELKKNAGITLEKSIYKALEEINETSITDAVSNEQNGTNEYLRILIKEQKETIARYEVLAASLFESNRILTDQIQNLIYTQEQLAIEKKEEEKAVVDKIFEKKGFFSRFLKK